MDPDGSPERTIEAIMKEPIGMRRVDYFPVPGEVEEGRETKRYYEPWFIKFTRDWLDKDTSDDVQYFVGMWLNSFIPLQPDSTVSILKQIDNLIGLKDTVVNYHWVGGNKYIAELSTYLQNARAYFLSNELIKCAREIDKLKQRVSDEHRDTLNLTSDFITEEGGKYLYLNAKYILQRLPQIPPSGPIVKLINSVGTKLTSGALQYYEGSWKDAVNNNDGTFFVSTTKTTLSLRMTYEYGTQTKSNVTVGYDTIVFQTVNAQVQLQNSSGVLIDAGTVQYYAGAWRNLGTTTNGVAAKDLLPNTYSFRMTYAYASKDKQQDIGMNATVVFQTVNAAVQLKNSQGNLIPTPLGDQGTVQYYSGAWRTLGTTTNGTVTKDLLPNTYSFRMTYAYASKDKQQDIGTNATVVFQTVNAAVQLKNSQGNLIDQGTVQYYSGAWRNLGTTTNGTVTKDLLPNTYSFRMTYEYVSVDKAQDISTNNIVSFSTVLCTIRVKNSQNQPVNGALASYYSGAWIQIGNTVNGEVTKELLPVNLSFRVKYGTQQKDKQQNLSSNNIVEFTVQ
jgi:hypothetical protein